MFSYNFETHKNMSPIAEPSPLASCHHSSPRCGSRAQRWSVASSHQPSCRGSSRDLYMFHVLFLLSLLV